MSDNRKRAGAKGKGRAAGPDAGTVRTAYDAAREAAMGRLQLRAAAWADDIERHLRALSEQVGDVLKELDRPPSLLKDALDVEILRRLWGALQTAETCAADLRPVVEMGLEITPLVTCADRESDGLFLLTERAARAKERADAEGRS